MNKPKSRNSRRSAGKLAWLRSMGDELAVCGSLSEAEIDVLAARGYRTIVDVRGAGEPIHGLALDAERRAAERAGLVYEHVPMAGSPLDGSRINDLRLVLWAAEPKILMHCGNGRRAALCAMIHLGCQSGWTIDQCLDFASEHGVDFDQMPVMRECLADYLQRHSRAYLGESVRSRPNSTGYRH